ncbi:MAG: YggS family pyridoxal phosphate-dependent enzyme [Roseiflexaceae bacterium]|nr:YggS family pyridoxal phosphate-dependent enzyme [Roseiflexaceae bacterium]
MSEQIAENIANIRQQIATAAQQAGRSPAEIMLIGVTKTHPAAIVEQALAAGLADVGENRVQEAESKITALSAERQRLTWHLIGHLQSNKAKKAAQLFNMIHSVDSLRLAQQLDRAASELRTQPLDILLQVNVSGEVAKEGFDLVGWETHQATLSTFLLAVEQIVTLSHLQVRGLMTIAPIARVPEDARPHFASTRILREHLAHTFPQADWSQLSMGMSNDFDAAIAEGATMVRIGRAIFGSR